MPPKAKAEVKAKAAPEPKAAAKAKAKAKEKVEKDPRLEELEKVVQPDGEAFKEQLAKVNEDIEKLNKKQAALTAKINERSGGKNEFFAMRAELSAQLDDHSAKLNELQAKKDEILKAVDGKKQEGRDMRTQLNKMKKAIGFTSTADIDDRIAAIEFTLVTDSVSLKEEKKLLAEIQELKRNKPKVSQVHKMEDNLQSFDTTLPMKDQLSSINEEMAKYREMKRAVTAKRQELLEGRKEQLGDLPEVIAERDEIGKKISEKIQERNGLRDEFRAKEKEYWAYQQELRKIRQEKQMEERQKRQLEFDQRRKERAADKLDEQPYVSEITLVEQTILFCKSLTESKGKEQKEEKKEIVHNNPDGTEVLRKKEDREDEYFFAPTKGKKSKGKAKTEKSDATAKPIKHNAETFRLFDKLKLDAPITTSDIPALLEKLEEQLEIYNGKVKEWEEKRDEMKRKILEEGILPEEDEAAEGKAKEDDKEDTKEGVKEAEKAED